MHDFQIFKHDITTDLADFNYHTRIQMLIDGYAKNYIRNVLNQHYKTIINAFEQELQYLLDSYQQTYSLEERSHIADCIHYECVFNFTNEPIPKELSDFISKGSKYVPYTKTALRISKKRFDECFCKTANRIVSRVAPYIKTGIDTKNIIDSIRNIIEKQKRFKNGKLSKILGSLLVS